MLRQSVIGDEPIEFVEQVAGKPVSAYRSQQVQSAPIPVIDYLLLSYIGGVPIGKREDIADLALPRVNLVRMHESDPSTNVLRSRSGKDSPRQVGILTPKPDAQGSPVQQLYHCQFANVIGKFLIPVGQLGKKLKSNSVEKGFRHPFQFRRHGADCSAALNTDVGGCQYSIH